MFNLKGVYKCKSVVIFFFRFIFLFVSRTNCCSSVLLGVLQQLFILFVPVTYFLIDQDLVTSYRAKIMTCSELQGCFQMHLWTIWTYLDIHAQPQTWIDVWPIWIFSFFFLNRLKKAIKENQRIEKTALGQKIWDYNFISEKIYILGSFEAFIIFSFTTIIECYFETNKKNPYFHRFEQLLTCTTSRHFF